MSASAELSPRRILVIDDNAAIHDDFRKILVHDSSADSALNDITASLLGETAVVAAPKTSFELSVALQGQEGLATVQAAVSTGRPFQMAFVDGRMPPGWDGIETTARLWAADPDLQVVICTAYSDYSWDDMLARLGFSDRLVILKKPFDAVEVLQLASALSEKYRLLQQVRGHLEHLEATVQQRTAELQKSEAHFRLITENADDLIGIVEAEDNWAYHSPSYEKLLGYSAAEFAATTAYQAVHPEDVDRVRASARTVLANGTREVLEYRAQHRDGSWLNLEAHAAPFHQSGGVRDSILLVARDVTGRKLAEAERRRMEIQSRQSQKLEAIGQLAAGLAHEINTPAQYVGDNIRFLQDSFKNMIAILGTYDTLLRAAKGNAITPEIIATVEATLDASDLGYLMQQVPVSIQDSLEGVERITKIVRALKEFSHLGGREKIAADLNRAIETTVTVTQSEWKFVAEVELKLDPQLPLVPCFVAEFGQCILNLVVNAAHAIGDVVKLKGVTKGVITIQSRRAGDSAEIRVSDTGTGIPEAVRPHIFEPFFTTKAVGKGTGQGLSIVYGSIVKRHGGTVTFETATGAGTTFILRLPLKLSASRVVAPLPAELQAA